MSIMPLLPTRLVSNLCFRIYTKKGVGVIHLCSSRHLSSRMLLTSGTRSMQRPTHIWQLPLRQRHNGRVVSIRRHLLRLLVTWGWICEIQVSLKALVNAYSNIYVRWFICLSDSLLDVAKISKIWHYQYDFPEKRKNMMQKSADSVKYYGKLCGFMRWQCCQESAGYWKKTRISTSLPLSQLPL